MDAILKIRRCFGFYSIEEGQSRTTLRIDIRYDVICLRSPPREEVSCCSTIGGRLSLRFYEDIR